MGVLPFFRGCRNAIAVVRPSDRYNVAASSMDGCIVIQLSPRHREH